MTAYTVAASAPGVAYVVTRGSDGWRCECKGYYFRHTCRHIKEGQRIMATPLITRNTPIDAATLDGVALQWANGKTEGRIASVGRFAPLVGWHIEVGRDDDIDRALHAAQCARGEIKHRREGGAPIVAQHWMLGENIRFFPLTAGPPYTSVKTLVARNEETAAAGLGARWPQGERSRLAVRGYLSTLLDQMCSVVVTLGARSKMTEVLLGALLDHCRACDAADALIDRGKHPAIVTLHELALPLGAGEEEEWGRGDTATVVPFASQHPATLDVAYIRQSRARARCD